MIDLLSPIKLGVFDSGLGGLTVLKELLHVHPGYSYVYYGDTANVPYGSRDAQEVIRLVSDISRHLVGEGCHALVVACNTSSALALSVLRTVVEVPIFGVIEPAAAQAAQATRCGTIVVLATPLTAKSGVYADSIRMSAEIYGLPSPKVVEIGCPELVLIAEEGDLNSFESSKILSGYADKIRDCGADTVVLGCTHYPLLLPVLCPLLGNGVKIIDPASLIPGVLAESFPSALEENEAMATVTFQVSGDPLSFNSRAGKFLGRPVSSLRVLLGDAALGPAPASA